jgi:phage shock protein E
MLKTVPELLTEARKNLRLLDAVAAMAECTDKGGTVIDVREPGEAQAKPAAESLNIPRGVLEMMALEKFQDANHSIYLHCASGARATLAAEQLARLGYADVTVISCGIDAVCEAQS